MGLLAAPQLSEHPILMVFVLVSYSCICVLPGASFQTSSVQRDELTCEPELFFSTPGWDTGCRLWVSGYLGVGDVWGEAAHIRVHMCPPHRLRREAPAEHGDAPRAGKRWAAAALAGAD